MAADQNIVIAAPTEYSKIKINKWRVREGFPVRNSQVILLYEICDSDDKEIKKLKATKVGVVKKRLFKDGAIVETGSAVLELSECVHTTVMKDMCADCGADLRQNENGNMSEASVPMVHSVPDLKVSQKLAQQLGHADTKRLLQDRKLVLLVDLDQTVIHTTNDIVPNNIKSIYHFQLYGSNSPWYHTRLRPGTSKFLKDMSMFYELHICTFGARNYAHMIAKLLDPEGKIFSHRILSRDECFNATSKMDNLKALFPNGDSMVCIIDDREDVWNMASNLIQVKPYHFFQHTGDINAPPGLSKHELDGEGVDFKDLKNLALNKVKASEVENLKNNEPKTSKNSDKYNHLIVADDCNRLELPVTTIDQESASTSKMPESDVDVVAIEEPTSSKKEEKLNTDGEGKTKTDQQTDPQTDYCDEEILAQKSDDDKLISKTELHAPPEKITDITKSKPPEKDDISSAGKLYADSPKLIEIEDPDDYLLYLEVILKTIHNRFYQIFDDTQEIPDLKIIVPKIRSEVLRDTNLVFSGLVPTNMKLEQSRAYFIAKSLGANVSQNIGAKTTHLVAVTSGTFKVNAAKKSPHIKVVNANWLWTCAERWEHVEEKLFPLDRKTKSKQRQPPAHCHSPEHVVNYSEKSEISSSSSQQQYNATEPAKFIDTINPLLSFSNADLADMNKEFDQFFESDSSSEDEHVDIENPPVDKTLRKRKREEKEAERQRDFFSRTEEKNLIPTSNPQDNTDNEDNRGSELEEGEGVDDDEEMPSTKFRRGEELPSDLEMGSDSNGSNENPDTEDDGDWNMMGAALEREFLGLEH